MIYRLTRIADQDLLHIAQFTAETFGLLQAERYRDLMNRGLERVARDPFGIGTRARDDLRPGRRTFHLALLARRRSAARHLILYRVDPNLVIILEICHDCQDPTRLVIEEN